MYEVAYGKPVTRYNPMQEVKLVKKVHTLKEVRNMVEESYNQPFDNTLISVTKMDKKDNYLYNIWTFESGWYK